MSDSDHITWCSCCICHLKNIGSLLLARARAESSPLAIRNSDSCGFIYVRVPNPENPQQNQNHHQLRLRRRDNRMLTEIRPNSDPDSDELTQTEFNPTPHSLATSLPCSEILIRVCWRISASKSIFKLGADMLGEPTDNSKMPFSVNVLLPIAEIL
ncbi:hypothetical protein Prudu_000700 [Prunus dulcis]|uniref:Uncharacterized protein n=1 Tax=Prunus dulcis TaxID=3755 RepID=A0A4Y1QM37_PRUDU|nr:hypothetical protein Prudu_000700 [Prunus dulcis]